MEKVKYYGRLTDAEIEKLKQEHGCEVFEITVPMNDDNTENAVCYVKKPDRSVLGKTSRLLEINPIAANEVILDSIWLAGDQRIKMDDEMFLSASIMITELVTVRMSTLKKK